jgi:hypothetical protein
MDTQSVEEAFATGKKGVRLAAGIVAAGILTMAAGSYFLGSKQDRQEECTATPAVLEQATKTGTDQNVTLRRGKDGACELVVK